MYLLRAILATTSVFAISYIVLSLAVAVGWRMLHRAWDPRSSVSEARFLYAVRMAPAAGSLLLAFCFELPSFILFEPRSTNELLSVLPIGLTLAVLGFAGWAAWRAVAICRTTREVSRQWALHSCGSGEFDVCHTNGLGPALAVIGIRNPKLLLSPELQELLTAGELDRAVAHERSHISQRDNLRKLTLAVCRFPGMTELERAWAEAAEFAADERAVGSRREALELASALVKISAMGLAPADSKLLFTNLVGEAGSTARRVKKLSEWREATLQSSSPIRMLVALSAATLTFLTLYAPSLVHLHALTEALFR